MKTHGSVPLQAVSGLAIAITLASVGKAFAVQQPEKAGVTFTVSARRVDYFADEKIIQARGGVRVTISSGVTVDGDACSIYLSLRRFVVAGHVRLATPAATYTGAAFADFLAYHRAYFIPLDQPDRWTFLNEDWASPENGREMPRLRLVPLATNPI